jgi:hypothetical protein
MGIRARLRRVTVADLLPFAVVLFFLACSAAELTRGGANVAVTHTPPPAGYCRELGSVIGHGGGSACGGAIANDDLIRYAENDARNQAAARGASHFLMQPPQLGGASGTTSTATVTGVAYYCAGPAGPTSGGEAPPPQVVAPPPPPPPPAECYPACRQGFDCFNGTCVSACNPPCAAGETCVGHGADAVCQPPQTTWTAPPGT